MVETDDSYTTAKQCTLTREGVEKLENAIREKARREGKTHNYLRGSNNLNVSGFAQDAEIDRGTIAKILKAESPVTLSSIRKLVKFAFGDEDDLEEGVDYTCGRLPAAARSEANAVTNSVANHDLPLPTLPLSNFLATHLGIRDPQRFFGREEALNELHQKLQQANQLAITSIRGIGGIGKTELAIQYARRFCGDYPGGVWWLRVPAGNLAGQIADITQMRFPAFNWEVWKERESETSKLQYCWPFWQGQGKALVIFDDVEDYDDTRRYLPTIAAVRVLVTTRLKIDGMEQLLLGKLSEAAALAFLASLVGEARLAEGGGEEAKRLCAELGYLPLALELVGKYLAIDEGLAISRLRADLQEQGMLSHEALNRDRDEGWTLTAERGVRAAFEMSWKYLNKAGEYVAIRLGMMFTVFGRAPIRWTLIEQTEEQDCVRRGAIFDRQRLTQGRIKLLSLSLIETEKENATYSIHPLILAFFREKAQRRES